MSLINELLKMLEEKQEPVTEGRGMYFSDMVTVKLDPDRDDGHDVAQKLMPAILQTAYVYLMENKAKHERLYDGDDEAPAFDVSDEALIEEAKQVIDDIKLAFDKIGHDSWMLEIEQLKGKLKR